MTTNKTTILVVEDNAINRAVLGGILSPTYTVLEAENGREALAILQEHKEDISLILLDIVMPGMDGFEVLRSVKKSNPQVQVIILTGHGGDAEEQTAYRMGAYNFLKKPMDIDELLNSIRMAYRDKVENAMVAVSLAEGGDFDAAQDVLNEKDLLAEHKL